MDDAQCLTARHIYDSWAQILAVAKENGRATDHFDNCFYHHIYIDEDKTRALHEARSFLDRYYSANYTEERLRSWLTCGSARECIADLRKFRGSGAHRITLRLSTEKKESEQFDKLVNDVLPYVNEGSTGFSLNA
ncbi:MAG: class flavin-dependent oxidoreductase [Betaproteobacteria bacterium]|nr:class flavin-dependent oxidoreductase [Betaproteobacteria bacterium]